MPFALCKFQESYLGFFCLLYAAKKDKARTSFRVDKAKITNKNNTNKYNFNVCFLVFGHLNKINTQVKTLRRFILILGKNKFQLDFNTIILCVRL